MNVPTTIIIITHSYKYSTYPNWNLAIHTSSLCDENWPLVYLICCI